MARTITVTRDASGDLIAQVTVISDPTPYSEDTVISQIAFLTARMADVVAQKVQQSAALDAEIARLQDEKTFYSDLLNALQSAALAHAEGPGL